MVSCYFYKNSSQTEGGCCNYVKSFLTSILRNRETELEEEERFQVSLSWFVYLKFDLDVLLIHKFIIRLLLQQSLLDRYFDEHYT